MVFCYIPLLQTGGGKGALGRIVNVVRRGTVFYFRRVVPPDLRAQIQRRELTCSLRTSEARLAKIVSKTLYVASECLFQTVRTGPMLSDEELSKIVRDFYSIVVERESAWRLNSRPLTEEARQARVSFFRQVAEQARLSLARNQFDDASFIAEAIPAG
jgi:hypothetical protein